MHAYQKQSALLRTLEVAARTASSPAPERLHAICSVDILLVACVNICVRSSSSQPAISDSAKQNIKLPRSSEAGSTGSLGEYCVPTVLSCWLMARASKSYAVATRYICSHGLATEQASTSEARRSSYRSSGSSEHCTSMQDLRTSQMRVRYMLTCSCIAKGVHGMLTGSSRVASPLGLSSTL